jgi:tetratricopeptide (TPR) repeat protein
VSELRSADARQLSREIRGELDWIVMKALEKDRARRYQSASAFAADIERYLRDEPVSASPPSLRYRLRKFLRRNRARAAVFVLFLATGLTAAGLLGGLHLQKVGRTRELILGSREDLAGARTAMEAGDLILSARLVAEARARLGAVIAAFPDLNQEIDQVQHEIAERESAQAAYRRFEKLAAQAQDEMSYSRSLGGDQTARQALGLYAVLDAADWLERLEASSLSSAQKRQVRETVYVTLVSLADFGSRWRGLREDRHVLGQCLELLRRAEAFHPPTRAFYFVRKQCNGRLGNAKAAEADLERFKAAPAQTGWDYYLPGHTAGWEGDLQEAMRAYQAALSVQPDHYNSLFFLAERLSREEIRRWPEAVAYMSACIALRPDHLWARVSRAGYHEKLGHRAEAEADYSAAVSHAQSEENRFIAYSYRWRFYRATKRLGAAEQDWRSLLQVIGAMGDEIRARPAALQSVLDVGAGLRGRKETIDLAIAVHREALRVAPHDAACHLQLAYDLYEKGLNPEADPLLEKGLALNPLLAGDAYIQLYHQFKRPDDLARALNACRERVRRTPTKAAYQEALGNLCAETGRFEEAIDCYRVLVRLDPRDPGLQNTLAGIYRKAGYKEEVAACYQEAVRLSPTAAGYRIALGHAHRELGDLEAAISCFRHAVRLQPDNRWSHSGLMVALLHKGDWQEAAAVAREALRHSDVVVEGGMKLALGTALQAAGQPDRAAAVWREAIQEAERQIRSSPSDWEPYFIQVRIFANCGDPRLSDPHRAVDLALRGVQLCEMQLRGSSFYADFGGSCWANLGLAHYRAGQWAAARAASEKAAALLPDDVQVVQTRLVLACACARLGDATSARGWYERAREWLDRTNCHDPAFCRLRDEAVSLLAMERRSCQAP